MLGGHPSECGVFLKQSSWSVFNPELHKARKRSESTGYSWGVLWTFQNEFSLSLGYGHETGLDKPRCAFIWQPCLKRLFSLVAEKLCEILKSLENSPECKIKSYWGCACSKIPPKLLGIIFISILEGKKKKRAVQMLEEIVYGNAGAEKVRWLM